MLFRSHGGSAFLKGHLFGDNLYDFLAPCIYEGEGEMLGMAFFKSLVKEHGKQFFEPIGKAAQAKNIKNPNPMNPAHFWAMRNEFGSYMKWMVSRKFVSRDTQTIAGMDSRLAEHVQHAAERGGTDGHLNRMAQIGDRHAALHAVGRLHRDRAHAVLAEVLLDLADDVQHGATALAVGDDAKRVVDFREVTGLELDVDDGADDLDDLADILFRHGCDSYSACAPETTSMISRVIAAWRTLFIYSVRLPII